MIQLYWLPMTLNKQIYITCLKLFLDLFLTTAGNHKRNWPDQSGFDLCVVFLNEFDWLFNVKLKLNELLSSNWPGWNETRDIKQKWVFKSWGTYKEQDEIK